MRVLVSHVNLRTEKNGEAEVLACDVALKVAQQEGTEWDELLSALSEGIVDAEQSGAVLDRLPFSTKLDNYEVILNGSPLDAATKVASLTHAKMNKFVLDYGDEKHRQITLSMRVQALTNGLTVGALSEAIGHTLYMSAEKMQQDLPLDEGEDDKR
jgi:hypothetical protein